MVDTQSSWLLPDHVSDVLPQEALLLERIRRGFLDQLHRYGYEFVTPPLLEYLGSLLTGVGADLSSLTFRLNDGTKMGHNLGLRADITPQIARIDAHVLQRNGVVRLCYAGDILRTSGVNSSASRETLQMGAELFGEPGIRGDIEILSLLSHFLTFYKTFFEKSISFKLVLSHSAWLNSCLLKLEPDLKKGVLLLLANRDTAALSSLVKETSNTSLAVLLNLFQVDDLPSLTQIYQNKLKKNTEYFSYFSDLEKMALHAEKAGIQVTFDLLDIQGFNYHSGVVWSLWVDGLGSPIARGGRYDGVGSVFGRGRAATGFSLDAKIISAFVLDQTECSKIPAILVAAKEIDHPDNSDLLEVVHKLRSQGEVVISLDQGNEYSSSQFELNRHLVKKDGTWVVQSFGK